MKIKQNIIQSGHTFQIIYKEYNKKLNPVVTELFIRGRKLGISIVFIT